MFFQENFEFLEPIFIDGIRTTMRATKVHKK